MRAGCGYQLTRAMNKSASDMQTFPAIVAMVLVLGLLAALGVGAFWVIAWLVGLFGTLDPQVAALTGILSVMALLTAMIVVSCAKWAGRHAIAGQLHAERTTTYSMFLELWQGLTLDGSVPPEEDDDAADALRTLDLSLSLYGSATVLKAHRTLWGILAADRLDEPQARETLLSALEVIRKELGASMIDLTRDDLREVLFADFGRDMASLGLDASRRAAQERKSGS